MASQSALADYPPSYLLMDEAAALQPILMLTFKVAINAPIPPNNAGHVQLNGSLLLACPAKGSPLRGILFQITFLLEQLTYFSRIVR